MEAHETLNLASEGSNPSPPAKNVFYMVGFDARRLNPMLDKVSDWRVNQLRAAKEADLWVCVSGGHYDRSWRGKVIDVNSEYVVLEDTSRVETDDGYRDVTVRRGIDISTVVGVEVTENRKAFRDW